MRLFAFLFALPSLLACSVASAVSWALAFAFDTIAGEPFNLRPPFSLERTLSAGGAAGITPALYQRNRHEAGVSRRAAARNV